MRTAPSRTRISTEDSAASTTNCVPASRTGPDAVAITKLPSDWTPPESTYSLPCSRRTTVDASTSTRAPRSSRTERPPANSNETRPVALVAITSPTLTRSPDLTGPAFRPADIHSTLPVTRPNVAASVVLIARGPPRPVPGGCHPERDPEHENGRRRKVSPRAPRSGGLHGPPPFGFHDRSDPGGTERRRLRTRTGQADELGNQRVAGILHSRFVRAVIVHGVPPGESFCGRGASSGAIAEIRSRNAARARVRSDSVAFSVMSRRVAMSRTDWSSRYFHSRTLP